MVVPVGSWWLVLPMVLPLLLQGVIIAYFQHSRTYGLIG